MFCFSVPRLKYFKYLASSISFLEYHRNKTYLDARSALLFSAVLKTTARRTMSCLPLCNSNISTKHILFSKVLRDQNTKGPPDVRLLFALLFLLSQKVSEPTNVLPLSLSLKYPGSNFPKCEIPWDERYPELWDTKRPKWIFRSLMFCSFCFALLVSSSIKPANIYILLRPCSSNISLLNSAVSKYPKHICNVFSPASAAYISWRRMCFLFLEPQKSENCNPQLHGRRSLLYFVWLLQNKACKMLCSAALFLQLKYSNMPDIFDSLQL